MSQRIHRRAEPVPYQSGLTGLFPGQESYLEFGEPTVRMIFCWCPPTPDGQPFVMGSPPDEVDRSDNEAQRPFILREGFWLAKHPVTQQQWTAVMGENPSRRGKGDSHPADNVSWDMTQTFFKRLHEKFQISLCLPREVQWEYACRAGTGTPFGIGTGTVLNAQMANFRGSAPYVSGPSAFEWRYREQTLPAGSFPPNAWGLHDMHGQLWEWCADTFQAPPAPLTTKPADASDRSHRVLRGGSWLDDGWNARSAYRFGLTPDYAVDVIGFRPCPSSISPGPEVKKK